MKKILCVILLIVALATAGSASVSKDIAVGATFGNGDTSLTTVDFRLDQPVKGPWGNELVVGVATGFDNFNQNTDVTRYSVGLGFNVRNDYAKLSVGFAPTYVAGKGDDSAYAGFYSSLDLRVSKSWFAQIKYTDLSGTDVAEGFQGAVGFKF